MPWVPELFSAPVLGRILEERRRERLLAVPFFDGLRSGQNEALTGSFVGEPELHHPVRGRIKGAPAFERFVADTATWMTERNIAVEDVNFFLTPQRGVEELVLHLDGDDGRIALPLALVADRTDDMRLIELRMYFSTWPLTGAHANRPPVLPARFRPPRARRRRRLPARARGRRRRGRPGGVRARRFGV